ncbi:unnamed protein product [Protopolystoma xenopodis]|uniref:Uncharacterized protein n=1 Tax=Protopolystoma xenopodis TaxID=117903 RepID=A0A448WG73_9PLAT|nr:unnamed protein product [Protopolystoma xenopodis]
MLIFAVLLINVSLSVCLPSTKDDSDEQRVKQGLQLLNEIVLTQSYLLVARDVLPSTISNFGNGYYAKYLAHIAEGSRYFTPR